MPMQNLVSSSPSPESKAEVLKCLGEIKRRLDFLTSLEAADLHSLFEIDSAALLGKAYMAVGQHLEIMPTIFPAAAFKASQPCAGLAPLAAQIKEMAELVRKTMRVLSGDPMSESLDLFRAAKKRAGDARGTAAVVVEEMRVFFA
jgi:hypothetical protein